MVDVNNSMPPAQAGKLLREILSTGKVTFWAHALEEMEKDGISQRDAINVIRGGQLYDPAELKQGMWRYRVHTPKFCVVVGFAAEKHIVVVTAWRKSR